MIYDPGKHHRRSIRLPEYDYTQPAAYFVTLVTWQRENLFGEIVGEEMRLNAVGNIANREWFRLSNRFPYIKLDEFIVMPNHVHMIVIISDHPCRGAAISDPGTGKGAAGLSPNQHPGLNPLRPDTRVIPESLGAIIRAYKSSVSLRYNRTRFYNGAPLWQRNYYEHIIRNEQEWERIRRYIQENPRRWAEDGENLVSNPAAMNVLNELASILNNRD